MRDTTNLFCMIKNDPYILNKFQQLTNNNQENYHGFQYRTLYRSIKPADLEYKHRLLLKSEDMYEHFLLNKLKSNNVFFSLLTLSLFLSKIEGRTIIHGEQSNTMDKTIIEVNKGILVRYGTFIFRDGRNESCGK